jgi:hypothetical protein
MPRARSFVVPAVLGLLLPPVWLGFVACETPARPPAIHTRTSALGACELSVSRVNVDQVGVDDGRLEFIEIAAPAGIGQTLGACGLVAVGSFEGGGKTTDPCPSEPASRFVDVSATIVPADGFVLLTRGGETSLGLPADATTTATTGPWLENGPDYLVLLGTDGPLLALQIGPAPSCTLPEGTPVETLPKDGDVSGTSPDEHILVRCPEGYRGLSLSASPPRTPLTCPPLPMPNEDDAGEPPPAPTASTTSPVPDEPPPAPTATTTTSTPPVPEPPPEPPPPTCHVRFDKVDVAQPATGTTTTRDTRELVELFVEGDIPPGATLATCGVATFAPYRTGTKSQVALCGDDASSYGEVAIGHLIIPSPPYLLLAQRPDADSPLSVSKTSALLSNGPDYLALRDARGLIVDAVSYPSGAAPTYLPACPGWEQATPVPACEDAAKKGLENLIAVRCSDGVWRAEPEARVTLRAASVCGEAVPAKNDHGGEAAGSGGADQRGGDGTPRPPLPAGTASGKGGAAGASPPAGQPRLPLRDSFCTSANVGASPAGATSGRRGALGLLGWLGLVGLGRRARARLLGRNGSQQPSE